MRLFSILAALALCPSATGQVSLSFASTPANYISVLGGKWFIGSQQAPKYQALNLMTVTTQLLISPRTDLTLGGSGNDVPLDAKLDPSGNIWIVGNTDSDDFPLVNPIVSQKVPYRAAGFVMELNPTATSVLFSSYLGGHQFKGLSYSSTASALTIDAVGNVYVGGTTDEPDFPTTPGAFLRTGPGTVSGLGLNAIIYSYAIKISSAGTLIYSTFLLTGAAPCTGGFCPVASSIPTSASLTSMAADPTGALTVCGLAYGELSGIGYVWRLASDASKPLWTNTVGSQFPTVTSLYMAQDSTGNVQLLGSYAPFNGATVPPNISYATPGLFSVQITADGTRQLNIDDYGASAGTAATGVLIDSSGDAYLAGTTSSARLNIPKAVPNLGSDFIIKTQILDAAGATVLYSLPHGVVTAPPTVDAAGNLQLLGAQGALLTLPANNSFTAPAVVSFANSASYAMNTGIYPGTLVSVFGYNFPSVPQVFIDGVPATVLFANSNQINVRLGSATAGVTPQPGAVSFSAPSVQSVGIFTVDGTYAAALNQDGTVNSAANPAAVGSIVSLFGTGTTKTNVTATINGFPVNVAYFGTAPGLSGMFQANIQVAQGQITLQPHDFSSSEPVSNAVFIYTK